MKQRQKRMAYSYAVPGSLVTTRRNLPSQPEEQLRDLQTFSAHTPFVNTSTQSFMGAQKELMEDSVPGGLQDEFADVTTRERIQPTLAANGVQKGRAIASFQQGGPAFDGRTRTTQPARIPMTGLNAEQKQLAALGNLSRHPAFKAAQLTDILNAPHINYWDLEDNRFHELYQHDTHGSPYINSHRLQLTDFHPGMFTEQFAGAFTGADRPEVTSNAQAQFRQILAGTDDRDRAIKLFAGRFGTPENLSELVKTGHLHESDLAALQNRTNGRIPQNEPMMRRTVAQQLNNVMQGAGRDIQGNNTSSNQPIPPASSLPGDFDWEPTKKKLDLSDQIGTQTIIGTQAGSFGPPYTASHQSLVSQAITDFEKWGGDMSHLSNREIAELKRIGVVKDLQVGHEKAILAEAHPNFNQRAVFNPNSAYHNWDGVGGTEFPRYPTHSYLELNNYGNKGE